jgi:hypothetical protein
MFLRRFMADRENAKGKGSETKWKIAFVVIIVLLISPFVVPFLVYNLTRPRFTDGVIVPYRVGKEIDYIPISGLSLKFTSWNATKQFHESGFSFDAENGSSLFVFRFILRNTSNKTVNLLEGDFAAKLNSAFMPIMRYRGTYENGTYYGGEEQVQGSSRWADHLFSNRSGTSFSVFEPNQTLDGVLVYQTLEGREPTQLTLRPWTAESNVMVELELEYPVSIHVGATAPA